MLRQQNRQYTALLVGSMLLFFVPIVLTSFLLLLLSHGGVSHYSCRSLRLLSAHIRTHATKLGTVSFGPQSGP